MARRSCLAPIPETLKGHVWKKKDGRVDMFALDAEPHNGPRCEKCNLGFCHHCKDLQTGNDIPECKG